MNYKLLLFFVFSSLVIVSSTILIAGGIFKRFIDIGINGADQYAINSYIFKLLLLIIIFGISSFGRSYYINLLSEKILRKIQLEIYEHLLKVKLTTFEEMKIGHLIELLSSDIQSIGKIIVNLFSFAIRNFIILTSGIIMMFVESVSLSMLVIFLVPTSLLPILRLIKNLKKSSKILLEQKKSLSSNIEEIFNSIRTVHAYNQQNNVFINFKKQSGLYLDYIRTHTRIRSIFFSFSISIIACAIIIVIWIGASDMSSGSISSGSMISFVYYSILTGVSAGGLSGLFSDMELSLSSLNKIFELKSIPVNSEKSTLPLPGKYQIEFCNVTFYYSNNPNSIILDNISLIIKENFFTAIVGESGSGKTTLMQIFLKFYDYHNGTIKIGGQDLNITNSQELRKKVAYVDQMPNIFSGTIRSNICFSKANATNEELFEVAKLCGIVDFANKFENGLDSDIGIKGIKLSGGQRQRISIARALLYEPEILILDEATSSLDNKSEKEIIKNIRKRLYGKTIISIAHRLSSIEDADEILVIHKGKLQNNGTHKALLKESKIYKTLYTAYTSKIEF